MSFIADIGVLVTVGVGMLSMLTMVYKVSAKVDKHVKEHVVVTLQSEDAMRVIERAIDNSQLSKKVDRLILVLCVNEPKLKGSSLCEGK